MSCYQYLCVIKSLRLKYTTTGDDDDSAGGKFNCGPELRRKYFVPWQIEEFTPGRDWKHYVERLEMFFKLNGVPTEKRVQGTLAFLGSKISALLTSISAPRRPKN